MADAPDLLTRAPDPSDGDLARVLGFRDVGAVAAERHLPVRRITPDAYRAMQIPFDDLAARSGCANPFMSPALVAASAVLVSDTRIVILAVSDPVDPERLVGVWCLGVVRDAWSLGLPILEAPLVPRYACHGAPVLDRQHRAAALQAMLAHIRTSADLPNTVRVSSWPAALTADLPAGLFRAKAETWDRAMLRPRPDQAAEPYLKAALAKTLNKRMNRRKQLARTGNLAFVTTRGAAAVAAFEHYIALEAKGWKGQSGTALAEVPEEAAYMRTAIAALAASDRLAVDMLSLDSRPIAVGVLAEAGDISLYWKAAYDETLARFAPGALLHLDVTRRLFAEKRAQLDSGMMEFTDPDAMPWSERQTFTRITFGHGPRAHVVAAMGHVRHGIRRLARRLRCR